MDNQSKPGTDHFVGLMGLAAISGWFVVESILYVFRFVVGG